VMVKLDILEVIMILVGVNLSTFIYLFWWMLFSGIVGVLGIFNLALLFTITRESMGSIYWPLLNQG
jgi:zinc transporter ZupT